MTVWERKREANGVLNVNASQANHITKIDESALYCNMKRIVAALASNIVFANILLVLILLAGGIAAMSMIRENFPEFSVDVITVLVAYPGADPEQVEEGISRKIEEALEGLEGVKQVTLCYKLSQKTYRSKSTHRI